MPKKVHVFEANMFNFISNFASSEVFMPLVELK